MVSVQLLRVSVHERLFAAAEAVLLQLESGEEAAELPALRALLTERLTAAAEEVVALFQETVAEYEDRVERAEREVCRQRRLLEALLKPQVRLTRADLQQLLRRKEEERRSSLDQEDLEDPEPPRIKEEQEEVWTSQQFLSSPVAVKSEDDEDKPQSSQLHHSQTEDTKDSGGGLDCGRPGPDPSPLVQTVIDYKVSEFSVAEIEVSCDDWEDTSGIPSVDGDEPLSEGTGSPADRPISCYDCSKTSTTLECLETRRTRHSEEKPLSCSVCGKKYTKRGYLVQHMSVHRGEGRQTCSVCNKSFLWQSGVECHQCDGGTRGVSECDKRLCYSHHLKKDTAMHPEDNLFTCSVCGRKFTQRGYLIQHMARHTGKIRYRCCVCDKRFAWRHDLKNHKCGDPSEASREAERPADPTEDSEGSDTDDKTSDSSEPEIEARDNVWNETDLNLTTEAAVGTTSDRKSFICSECGKTFCGKDNMKMHMKTHTGETPFGCSFCDKGLTQTRQLSVHSEEKRFLYCVCGKRFAWRYNQKNHNCVREPSQLQQDRTEASDLSHMQTEVGAEDCRDSREPQSSLIYNRVPKSDESCDPAERPFCCSQCGKRFRRKKNLQEHLRIHTGEKPYGCSVCMKYFSCSGSLRKHMRIHTGEKPFSCSVCGNRFTESGHLKVHMRTHTGEKPFSCSVCGKSFTWRQSFNNHIKYHSARDEG